MQKRMKTEKDYDAALEAIDCEIVEHTKAADEL